MHHRLQGDRGEWSAMSYFAERGASVAYPIGHSPDYDFIADFASQLLRVQVEASQCFVRDRYSVTTCTRGGNQSWSGLVKRLDASKFDVLLAVVGDGRRGYIPSEVVEGHTGLLLGGPKYARYEVERGRHLDCAPAGGAPELESRAGL